MTHSLLLPGAALLSMTTLAVFDHRSGRMPNWLTLSSWALALLARGALSGPGGMAGALVASILVAAGPLGLFFATRGEGIGGGDVKALFALGAWLGVLPGLQAELLALVALIAFAFAREARRGRLAPLLVRSFSLLLPGNFRRMTQSRNRTGESPDPSQLQALRFGPFLALGTWVLCLSAWLSPLKVEF